MTATLLVSRRDSTVRIYNSTWKVFHNWCTARHLDPLASSQETILDFLQDDLERKLRPATLRRQVVALDSVLSIHGGRAFARHPWIQRSLKGAEALNPPQIHRFPT